MLVGSLYYYWKSKRGLYIKSIDEYGKGVIWDMAYGREDILRVYRNLLKMREEVDLTTYARWYRENFFIEPTKKNIIKAFEL